MKTSRAVRKVTAMKLLSEIPASLVSKWCGFNMNESSGNIGDSALSVTNNDTTAYFHTGLILTGTTTNAYDNVGFITTDGADFELEESSGSFTIATAAFESFADLRDLANAGSGHMIVAYGGKFADINADQEEFMIDVRAQWFIKHADVSGNHKLTTGFKYGGGSTTTPISSIAADDPYDGTFRHMLVDIDFNSDTVTQYVDGGLQTGVILAAAVTGLDPIDNAEIALLGQRVSTSINKNIGVTSTAAAQIGYFYMFRVEGKDVSASMQSIADGFMKNNGEIPYAMEGI